MTTALQPLKGAEIIEAMAGVPAVVSDEISKAKAIEDLNFAKAYVRDGHSVLDPIVAERHRFWKEGVAERDRLLGPAEDVATQRSRVVLAYDQEQRRLADVAERKRQEEIQKQEQAQKDALKKAADLEAKGKPKEAQKVLAKADAAIASAPPPPAAPPPPSKTKGVRKTWSPEVTSIKDLCRAVADGKVPEIYVEANLSVMRPIATAKGKSAAENATTIELGIPGVVGVSKESL